MKRAVRKLDKREAATMEMLHDWLDARSEPMPTDLWRRLKNFFDDIGFDNFRIEEGIE